MSLTSPLEQFGRALVAIGAENERVVVLDPDLSTSTKTSYFAERFPDRFINVGISEQDMIGVAAGLAAAGRTPIACGYSIFTAGRAWEQIANSVARPNLDVKIVATHGGLSPFADGDSHQNIGDVATMRVLPNMRVVVPADAASAVWALEAIVRSRGPAYLRLGREATPMVHEERSEFTLGRASPVRDGADAAVIANGVMVALALEAAEDLSAGGLDVGVIDMHTVKPIDADRIIGAARETGAIVTAEEHSVIGGLGSAVCEVLSQSHPTPVQMVGIRDRFGESSRDYRSLLAKHGLSAEGVSEAVYNVLKMRR
ncbi:transketolase [miscellaneous Crenarchaeota group-15 archaeon DG-45]|uniref:Transketolase n=1 Tax=miscellaneous Crenarchaeota group-15 archaeon DG-45 TaxID=1685127 RepID=A0A0M0BT38_9ARCH|nr:MAG: transketolase [miscellaneous Crenarchaeota group-15 archaeon DG-45]